MEERRTQLEHQREEQEKHRQSIVAKKMFTKLGGDKFDKLQEAIGRAPGGVAKGFQRKDYKKEPGTLTAGAAAAPSKQSTTASNEPAKLSTQELSKKIDQLQIKRPPQIPNLQQPVSPRKNPLEVTTNQPQPVSPRKNPFEATTNQPQPVSPRKNPFESQPEIKPIEVRNLPTDAGTSNQQQPVSPRNNPFETTTNQPTPSISVAQPSSGTATSGQAQGSSSNPPLSTQNVGNTQINTGVIQQQPQMFQIPPQGATGQYVQPVQMIPGSYYYYPAQYGGPIQPGQPLTQLQPIQPGQPVYPTGAYYYPYYNPST